jgi:hypothetical protein
MQERINPIDQAGYQINNRGKVDIENKNDWKYTSQY